jgi:hypothetical protein
MILGIDASYYPRACFLRIGRRLFNVRMIDNISGQHFWEAVVHAPSFPTMSRSLYTGGLTREYHLCLAVTSGITPTTPYGVRSGLSTTIDRFVPDFPASLTVYVWRIQRAMRAFLRRRRVARAVAVAMGWHERLGSVALLAGLPTELVPLFV